jgi:FixJ family two-component response regulator
MDTPAPARRPANRFRSVAWQVNDDNSQRAPDHFLIASDDDQLREIVNAALRQLGYTGTFVRSGADVVNSNYGRQLSLVLLDQCLRDLAGLDVARALSAGKHQRFVLIGNGLTTSDTVAAMKLGALTVLEKPVALSEIVALLRSVVDESWTATRLTSNPPATRSAPRSVAERWALKVLRRCAADGDPKTLGAWASVAGLSYSSLCETCRLVGVQPLAARDLTRVLRALVQSQVHDCRIGDLLDICDGRTLNALMTRAAMDPRRHGGEISVDQFLTSQRFVPAGNAGLAMLRALLPREIARGA